MGIAVWYFVRHGKGDIRPAPLRAMEDFFHDEGAFPEAATHGNLEYVEVLVVLTDRRPTVVHRVGYYRYRVDARGMMDQVECQRRMRMASEIAGGHLPELDRHAEVLNARHKFAAREFRHMRRWKPTEADAAAGIPGPRRRPPSHAGAGADVGGCEGPMMHLEMEHRVMTLPGTVPVVRLAVGIPGFEETASRGLYCEVTLEPRNHGSAVIDRPLSAFLGALRLGTEQPHRRGLEHEEDLLVGLQPHPLPRRARDRRAQAQRRPGFADRDHFDQHRGAALLDRSDPAPQRVHRARRDRLARDQNVARRQAGPPRQAAPRHFPVPRGATKRWWSPGPSPPAEEVLKAEELGQLDAGRRDRRRVAP